MDTPGKRYINLDPPRSIYDYVNPDVWHKIPEAEKFIAFLLYEVCKHEDEDTQQWKLITL